MWRLAHPLCNVLIILLRAANGLFPTPASPNGVPMIKAKRKQEHVEHL